MSNAKARQAFVKPLLTQLAMGHPLNIVRYNTSFLADSNVFELCIFCCCVVG
jgi:hypothetical protein